LASGTTFRYNITVDGADDVKRAFEEIQDKYKQGIITQREAAESTRDLARDTRLLTNEHRAQAQIFLASHPALMQLNNTMQVFAGTARTALSVINALNLAQLAFAGQSDKVSQLKEEIVELQRQLLHIHTPEEGQLVKQEIIDKQKELNQAIADQNYQHLQSGIIATSAGVMMVSDAINIAKHFNTLKTSVSNVADAVKSIGTNAVNAVPNVNSLITALKALATTLNTPVVGSGTLGAILLGTSAGLAITNAFDPNQKTLTGSQNDWNKAISQFFSGLANSIQQASAPIAAQITGLAGRVMQSFTQDWPKFLAYTSNYLLTKFMPDMNHAWSTFNDTFFSATTTSLATIEGAIFQTWDTIGKNLKTMWGSIKGEFISFLNGLISVLNSAISGIASGLQGFANSFISAINAVISAYDRLPGPAKIFGDIGQIGQVSITAPSIPFVAAAKGFEGTVNSPTLFMVGERGAESVSIRPSVSQSSSGGGNIVIINVQGSIRSDKEFLSMVDRYFRTQARRYGFNGLLS